MAQPRTVQDVEVKTTLLFQKATEPLYKLILYLNLYHSKLWKRTIDRPNNRCNSQTFYRAKKARSQRVHAV